jgi:hypothetical protein
MRYAGSGSAPAQRRAVPSGASEPITREVALALAAWIIIACAGNLLWIAWNAAPPHSWDDANYLADSVGRYRALAAGHWMEFVRLASRPADGVHPPMVALLPIPSYLVFGPGTRSALYAFTALVPVFCVYVFGLGRLLSRSNMVALFAVMLTCAFPLTFGFWRAVLTESGLALAVVATEYHLLQSTEPGSRRALHEACAGAFLGWALLWKISAVIFAAGPICFVVGVRLLRDDRSWRSCAATILRVFVAAALVAGPFYLLRWHDILRFALFNAMPSPALAQFSQGPIFSLTTLMKYWLSVVNVGWSAYLFLLLAVCALVQAARRTWPLSASSTWFLVSITVFPIAFFSVQFLKEPRHVAPAFAGVGILLAVLLRAALDRIALPARAVVAAALFAFPLYQYLALSYRGVWAPAEDVRLGPLVLLAGDRDHLFVRPANPQRWPVRDVTDLIAAHSHSIVDHDPRVRVAGHIPFIDGPGLKYQSLLSSGRPLVYSSAGDRSLHPTWWDFVVVMSGPTDDRVEYREPRLSTLLRAGWLPFVPVGAVNLPGQRLADVYRAGPVTARIVGADLLTARDGSGQLLFSVTGGAAGKATANGPVVATGLLSFEYLYVPDSADLLTWNLTSTPGHPCTGSYDVTVADLNSRRGPARQLTSTFTVSPSSADHVSLAIGSMKGQIVTVRFAPTDGTASCIGWSEVRLVSSTV